MIAKAENISARNKLSKAAVFSPEAGDLTARNPSKNPKEQNVSPVIRYLPLVAGVCASLVGILVLIGWSQDIEFLKTVTPGAVAMKPFTAISFFLLGLSLILLHDPDDSAEAFRVVTGRTLAIVAALISVQVIAEYIFNWNSGLDTMFFPDAVLREAVPSPGRMSPITAFNFLLLSFGLLTLKFEIKNRFQPAQWIAAFLLLISYLSIVGYLNNVRSLYQVATVTAVAWHSAVTILILSIGLFFTRGDKGFAAILLKKSAGGLLIRRLFPAVVLFPFVLRFLRWFGQDAGLFDNEMGQTLSSLTYLVAFTFLIWRTALSVDRAADERLQAKTTIDRSKKELHDIKYQLAAIVESSEDSILSTDLNGIVTSWNKGAEQMYGYSAKEMIGQTKSVLLSPEDMHQLKSELEAARSGKRIEHYEAVRIRKDGARVTVFVATSPIRDYDGKIAGVSFIARDITEKKQAEAELNESRAQLQTIVENLDEGVTVSDLDGNILHFNRAAVKMHGFEDLQECLINLTEFVNIFELRTIDDAILPTQQWPLARVLNGESLKDLEIRIRRIGSDWHRIFNYGGTLVHDENGKPLMAVVTIDDITERKKDEESLKNSEHRFRSLIEYGTDSIALINGEHEILYLSPSVKTVEGYEPEELIGRSGVEHTHPDDLPSVKNVMERLLINPGKAIPRIWRRKHKDGRWIWLEGISINLLNDPAVGAIVTNYRDITKRKEAEEELRESEARYRLLFENNPYPMWVYDIETLAFLAVNESATHFYGYSPEEFLSMTIKDIRPSEDVPALLENVTKPLHKIDDADVWRHRKKDGTLIDMEITSHELLFDGRSSRLVLANDVTVRKQAEKAIRELNETLEQRVVQRTHELEAANKELEAFSYSVSHDLRAPLRAIDGFSLALLDDYAGKLDDEGKNYLERVRAGSQRMAQLIDDLLKLSRITRDEFVRETIDLSKLAADVCKKLSESQPERNVIFEIQPDVTAFGDERLLRVALENLLGNAWKFTSKTENAKITFGRNGAEYFVRDNGAGFDMAYADKLFGAFQRLHSATDFEGTGIGLATVSRVIRRHGGSIRAESTMNEETTFYFTLSIQETHHGK